MTPVMSHITSGFKRLFSNQERANHADKELKHRVAFKDARLQSIYEKNGYVIVPISDCRLIEQARQDYQKLPLVQRGGSYSSVQVINPEYRRASSQALAPLSRYLIETWLDNYQLITSSYVCKAPGESSKVVPHQDWTFVDETRWATLNIWCPLVDVDHINGALYLLKGSHHLGYTIRGTLTPFAYEQVLDALTFDNLEYVPMKAGEAIIYDVRTIHASPPNTSPELRLVAGISSAPAEAQIIHYFQNPDSSRLERYEIGDDFWMNYTFGQNRMPEGTRFLGYEDNYVCPRFTLADIQPLLTRKQVTSYEERLVYDRALGL